MPDIHMVSAPKNLLNKWKVKLTVLNTKEENYRLDGLPHNIYVPLITTL